MNKKFRDKLTMKEYFGSVRKNNVNMEEENFKGIVKKTMVLKEKQ